MTLQQRTLISTPLEQLRTVLGQLEAHIGKLNHDPREEVLKIPQLFDTAYTALVHLRQAGVSIPAEEARFGTVSAQFEKKGTVFLRKIGGVRSLEALRQQETPATDRWWWYVDRVLADQQKMQLRHQGKKLLIGGVIIAVLALLYLLFLAPDKATRAKIQHQQNAEQLAQDGAYGEALDEIHQALTNAPDDIDLLVWQGVLEHLLGREDAANVAFATAEAIVGSRQQFLLERAQVYLNLYQSEALLADAEAVIRLDPDAPYGYFYSGQAYLQMGNYLVAQKNYEQTATLAAAAGETELEAIARIQIAQLYQMMMAPPEATPTKAP
jgi:tetratricopeptide (TPR) repeat protein